MVPTLNTVEGCASARVRIPRIKRVSGTIQAALVQAHALLRDVDVSGVSFKEYAFVILSVCITSIQKLHTAGTIHMAMTKG